MELKLGICDTCKFFCLHRFITYCEKEDELAELDIDIENVGSDESHQCPLWQPAFRWCKHHNEWYLYECGKCIEEMAKDMEKVRT